ncbi:hypothetical protein KEM48_002708 [Puccinia striiformis f. sp. tritici PST-130]|nr:hypothetical protein KEM48_002708 [Puccinia striiformis f. sp. tritici PST-130]
MEDFPSDVIDELPLDVCDHPRKSPGVSSFPVIRIRTFTLQLANPTTFYCLPSTTTLYNHPHLPESKFTRCAYPMKVCVLIIRAHANQPSKYTDQVKEQSQILTRAEEEDHYQAVIKGAPDGD